VHQDGLVHISHLADAFVKDPHDVVKTGEMVKVKVLEIDLPRKRIALSMKKEAPVESKSGKSEQVQAKRSHKPKQVKAPTPAQGSMANALAKALNK